MSKIKEMPVYNSYFIISGISAITVSVSLSFDLTVKCHLLLSSVTSHLTGCHTQVTVRT